MELWTDFLFWLFCLFHHHSPYTAMIMKYRYLGMYLLILLLFVSEFRYHYGSDVTVTTRGSSRDRLIVPSKARSHFYLRTIT